MAVTTVQYGGETSTTAKTSTAAQAPRDASVVAKLYAASAWAYRADNAQRRSRYQRLLTPLVSSLADNLGTLSTALGRFQWPANDSPLSFGRLAVVDSGLDTSASAAVLAAGTAPRQEKFLSLARAASASTTLADPDADAAYAFTLTQGGQSRTVSVTVPAGADWEGVLTATADAINATDLPVQASVVYQAYAGQKLPGVNKSGTFLDISVNPAHPGQDVTVADASGHLASTLDLTATEAAATPAPPARYDLRIASLAKPASLATSVMDFRADSGLSAGEYKLKYDLGDTSGTVTVNLDDNMTWDQVLRRTADAINSSTGLLAAEVKDAPRVSGLTRSDAYWTDGKYLEVSLASPKLGQRLSLTEYGGPWLDPVDDFFNPTGALPQNPSPGDSYIASATANGWTAGRIYQYNGSTWDATTPTADNALTLRADNADYFYNGLSWSTTADGSLLANLDFQPTANPGSDATIQVNGRAMDSETGVFSLDQGRVNLAVSGTTGTPMAVTVKQAAGEMASRMADIVDSYNSLSALLLRNADLLDSSLPAGFRDPVSGLGPALANLGLDATSDATTLSFDSTAFTNSLARDPATAKSLLLDPASGLLTRWARATDAARNHGVAKSLLPPTLFADLGPPPAEQLRLEESGRLLDVVESAVSSTAKLPDLLDTASALSGLAAAKHAALASPLLPEGAARLLKLEG